MVDFVAPYHSSAPAYRPTGAPLLHSEIDPGSPVATVGNLLELFPTGRPTSALVLDTVHPAQGHCTLIVLFGYNTLVSLTFSCHLNDGGMSHVTLSG